MKYKRGLRFVDMPLPGQALMELPASVLNAPRAPKQKQHGHAAIPGTGPAGETCGSCKNLHRNQVASTYLKCWLMRSRWTGGYATDVRAKDAACKQWEKLDVEPARVSDSTGSS